MARMDVKSVMLHLTKTLAVEYEKSRGTVKKSKENKTFCLCSTFFLLPSFENEELKSNA